MVCMGNLSNSWYANFSNPPTNINFDHPEYLGQPDSYGDIPGHRVFSFLDLRVLWTLKSSLVLIFGMRFVDRKTQQQRSEKPMGNTIQFVPSLLGAVISVVAMSYNFLTCEKHSIRFIETLRNYQQRKPLPKIFKMRQSLFADSFFVNTADIQDVIYTSEGDFSCLSLEAVMFCFFVSFQQFIFRSTSNQLAASLFNTYGYHFSFHRCMMKELTIVSNPDFQFQLLHSTINFADISSGNSRYQMDNYYSPQNNKSNCFSFFPCSFPKGYNKT